MLWDRYLIEIKFMELKQKPIMESLRVLVTLAYYLVTLL